MGIAFVRSVLLGVAPVALATHFIACNALLSNDPGTYDGGTVGPAVDAYVAPQDAAATCTGKVCSGTSICIEKDSLLDPNYGCTNDTCVACSGLKHTVEYKCTQTTATSAFECHSKTCAVGYFDCDGTGNGCTTSISAPKTCGGCGGKDCTAGGTKPGAFCTQSNGGGSGTNWDCADKCDSPKVLCSDGACLNSADVQSDPARCGTSCEACPAAPVGSLKHAICSAGTCDLACDNGYRECGKACVSILKPCGTECVAPLTYCGGSCVAKAFYDGDSNNCGSCGNVCPYQGTPGSTVNCLQGSCQCTPNYKQCAITTGLSGGGGSTDTCCGSGGAGPLPTLSPPQTATPSGIVPAK